jgi:protein SCO1/2
MKRRFPSSIAAAAAFALCAGAPAQAHGPGHNHEGHGAVDHSQHQQAASQPVKAQSTRVTLKEASLVDQNGRAVKLQAEAIGERIAIVDFIYTNCTSVCPVNSALLAKVQDELGPRIGKDVALLSITVDPVRDTPARLKEFAGRYGSGAGWLWLTGAKPQVDEALKAFDAYTPNFVEHPALIMVGDAKSGQWLRFVGFPDPKQITEAVRQLTAARAAHAGHAATGSAQEPQGHAHHKAH